MTLVFETTCQCSVTLSTSCASSRTQHIVFRLGPRSVWLRTMDEKLADEQLETGASWSAIGRRPYTLTRRIVVRRAALRGLVVQRMDPPPGLIIKRAVLVMPCHGTIYRRTRAPPTLVSKQAVDVARPR